MKKGISILSLAIVIVILSIITSTIVVSYSDSINTLNKTTFITEFMTLESAVQNFYEMNNNYPILEEITLTYQNTVVNEQFEGEDITSNSISLYKLDIATLGFDNLYLGNGKDDADYYALSMKTGKLYYLNGIIFDNITYYRVTEDLIEDYE